MTLGTCSICGGAVTASDGGGHFAYSPVPTCKNCGAIPALPHGPVIQMRNPRLWENKAEMLKWFKAQNPTNSPPDQL